MTAASAPEHPASAEDGQLARLFERNAKWAEGKTDIDPGFFQRLVDQQKPRYFWIGCSDSRVPATEIVDLDPGEMFVHRNVANLTKPDDPNFLAALQFAVDVLKVEHVIVVGHYGCGGVHAAMNGGVPGAISRWLEPLGALHARLQAELGGQSLMPDELCRRNVSAQVDLLAENPMIRKAWASGTKISLHGWVYSIADGLLEVVEAPVEHSAALAVNSASYRGSG
ncbi:MAG: carbonic anhydrase [Sphingomonadaceae bacterium]